MSKGKPPQLPPTLKRVLKGNSCAGCGMCAGVDPAIRIERDAKGWLRPVAVAEPAPETEELMQQACPGARISPWPLSDAPQTDPVWGPVFRSLTGHASDAEMRHKASSGGILSALALYLLNSGQVDRVLHVGMDPERPLETHILRSSDRDGIIEGAGSRYAPAAPLETLRRELDEPGRILFIGKPCDVGAMRQLMQVDAEIAERFPYLLSFFCAGTPSQDGTTRLVQSLGVEPDEVASFRYRGDGWPGYATATTADGHSASISYADSWGGILSKEVQFRCKICPDGIGGAADVAAADAWYGGESGYPDFDEAEGRSLILTRTSKGDALVAEAERDGAIRTEVLDMDQIALMQPSQARRRKEVRARMAAMTLTGLPRPIVDGLWIKEASRQAGARQQLRAMLGMARRILTKRF